MTTTTEIEIEWRRRITIGEAQRILCERLCGQTVVHLEDYRVRNHGEIHRRLGEHTIFANGAFRFDSRQELIDRLAGPFSQDNSSSNNNSTRTTISLAKLTTCFHKYYYYDDRASLRSNNEYPRIFVCKSSAEIADEPEIEENSSPRSPCVSPSRSPSPSPPPESPRDFQEFQPYPDLESHGYETRTPNVYYAKNDDLDLGQLKERLARAETFEMDRSDNNLGLRFYRKLYYFHDQTRVCLYAILDEFGTVRYEVGVERELAPPSSMLLDDLREQMRKCSETIEQLLVPLFTYTECPSINLALGWSHYPGAAMTNATVRSLSCGEIDSQHINRYENLFNNIVTHAAEHSHQYLLKLKLDGTRVFGVYNGAQHFSLSNGLRLHLHKDYRLPERHDYRDYFSTDFVYQLEQLPGQQYFITDVLAIRNRYSDIIQPPLHGYSAATQRYKRQPGQEWPYNMIGTELAENTECLAALLAARENSCKTTSAGISTNANAATTQQPNFVPVAFDESRLMLEKLMQLLPRDNHRRLHVNPFYSPATLLPTMLRQQFARHQYIAIYRTLIDTFSSCPEDSSVCQHIINRCQSVLLTDDWKQLMAELRNETTTSTTENLDWFYDFRVDQMFRFIDGCLLYRRPRARNTQLGNPHCRFPGLRHGRPLEAYKLKTLQTIELMYAERRVYDEQGNASIVREFKTDDFHDSWYFSQRQQENDDTTLWQRFDMTDVRVFVPHSLLPLSLSVVYELVCETKLTFYLMRTRPDKHIPDSNFKVNSIVFCRSTLHDTLLLRNKKKIERPRKRLREKKDESSSSSSSSLSSSSVSSDSDNNDHDDNDNDDDEDGDNLSTGCKDSPSSSSSSVIGTSPEVSSAEED